MLPERERYELLDDLEKMLFKFNVSSPLLLNLEEFLREFVNFAVYFYDYLFE